jgi:hypothetical protein
MVPGQGLDGYRNAAATTNQVRRSFISDWQVGDR